MKGYLINFVLIKTKKFEIHLFAHSPNLASHLYEVKYTHWDSKTAYYFSLNDYVIGFSG